MLSAPMLSSALGDDPVPVQADTTNIIVASTARNLRCFNAFLLHGRAWTCAALHAGLRARESSGRAEGCGIFARIIQAEPLSATEG